MKPADLQACPPAISDGVRQAGVVGTQAGEILPSPPPLRSPTDKDTSQQGVGGDRLTVVQGHWKRSCLLCDHREMHGDGRPPPTIAHPHPQSTF